MFDLIGEPLVCFTDLSHREYCFAKRASIMLFTPALDTLSMEVVANITGQYGDECISLEVTEADGTLGMLFELKWIEHAGHHTLVFIRIGVEFTAFADPFEHLADVYQTHHGEKIQVVIGYIEENFFKNRLFELLLIHDNEESLIVVEDHH